MKKLLLLLFTIGFMQQIIAQNNIYNPFEKHGYKPKIATLSQGKYNEFFDLDTVVQIGTVLYNTKSKEIVAFVEQDTFYSEATLDPDLVSRWLSPDPLFSERSSLSPYNFVQNSPIIRIDPTGMLDDVYTWNEEKGDYEKENDIGGDDYDFYVKDDNVEIVDKKTNEKQDLTNKGAYLTKPEAAYDFMSWYSKGELLAWNTYDIGSKEKGVLMEPYASTPKEDRYNQCIPYINKNIDHKIIYNNNVLFIVSAIHNHISGMDYPSSQTGFDYKTADFAMPYKFNMPFFILGQKDISVVDPKIHWNFETLDLNPWRIGSINDINKFNFHNPYKYYKK